MYQHCWSAGECNSFMSAYRVVHGPCLALLWCTWCIYWTLIRPTWHWLLVDSGLDTCLEHSSVCFYIQGRLSYVIFIILCHFFTENKLFPVGDCTMWIQHNSFIFLLLVISSFFFKKVEIYVYSCIFIAIKYVCTKLGLFFGVYAHLNLPMWQLLRISAHQADHQSRARVHAGVPYHGWLCGAGTLVPPCVCLHHSHVWLWGHVWVLIHK